MRPLPHRSCVCGRLVHRASCIAFGVPSRMPSVPLSRVSGPERCLSTLPPPARALCALLPVFPALRSLWSQGTVCAATVVVWGAGVSASVAPLPGLPGGVSELAGHFERHGLSPSARASVLDMVQGDPVRRVGGGRGNAVLRYASRKMGVVVQAESRTVEGAFVQRCEFDPEVVLYLCQPTTLTVRIVDARGRKRSMHTVVDFLVLNKDGFFLVECKSADEIGRDSERPHPRFICEDRRWRWPAAEEAAQALGLGFILFTSEEVNSIFLRNLRFLADYLHISVPPDRHQSERIVECVRQARSVRLGVLLASPDFSPDVVWWLVAHGRLWCDLERERVFEPDEAWVHDSEARMLAYRRLRPTTASGQSADSAVIPTAPVRIEPDAVLLWDGVPWQVIHRGSTAVSMQRQTGESRVVSLPVPDVDRLLQEGALRSAESPFSDVTAVARDRLFRRAGGDDLGRARERWRVLQHVEQHGGRPEGISARSVRRYRRWAKEGERRYGSAFAGLIRLRGRRPGTSDLPASQVQVLREVVDEFADDRRAGRLSAAYSRLVDLCAERGVSPPPSESTLYRALARASVPKTDAARRGSRAGYQSEGPSLGTDCALLPHGDRPFEIAHIDHTPLDVRLVSSVTGAVLGSPWLTLMVDAYSRMPLAAVLSFDSPSRQSVARVLFDCVRRHHRVPDTLVLDQGPEFHSHDVEDALAYLQVHKLERPARKARFGAVMERFFGITNTRFVHELTGNTTLLALGRSLSSDRHPSRSAVWTLPLVERACDRWLFEVYPDLVHGTLGETPRAVFQSGLGRDGQRVARYVSCDDALRILLAQTPRGVTRQVDSVRGIVIDYLRFWHDDFQFGDVAATSVPVKLDLADCSVAFAYVRSRWITCRLADGDADLHGRSWRQIQLAVEVLRQRRRAGRAARTINAALIGRFLRDLDQQEHAALARQIARDAEARPASPSASAVSSELRLVARDGALCDQEPTSGSPIASDSSTSSGADEAPFSFDDLESFDVN